MPEPIQDVKSRPSRSYRFDLKIGKLNYTNDLVGVTITNTIYAAYPNIILDLLLDPNDIILEKIYGSEPIYLNIKLIGRGEENVPLDSTDFELMYLQGDEVLPQKGKLSSNDVKERSIISFLTVSRQSYITMTSFCNELLEGVTPRQAIETIVKKNTNATLDYDSDNENKTIIDQLIISSNTIYNTINYIDSNFGLFNGSSNFGGYCQYDNTIHIMNLSKKITKNQTFTIYHLSTDSPEVQKIVSDSIDGKTFYTYMPLFSDYSANTIISSIGENIKYVLKPLDRLFGIVEKTFSDVAKQHGAVYKNDKIHVDPKSIRKVYKTMQTGVGDLSDTFLNARLSRSTINLATLTLDLEKNLPILPLMKVGEAVKINSKTVEYTDITGKYLLKSSVLKFEKSNNDWSSTASLSLVRTNKTI